MKHLQPYLHTTLEIAHRLRKQSTEAERLLWEKLRDRRLKGLKFRRQHPIGRYIVDFYCGSRKLAVELEGEIHETPDQKKYDEVRFEEIENRGVTVVRIMNQDVVENIESVLQKIVEASRKRS